MLSDFDCACILESDKRSDSLTMTRGEITVSEMYRSLMDISYRLDRELLCSWQDPSAPAQLPCRVSGLTLVLLVIQYSHEALLVSIINARMK